MQTLLSSPGTSATGRFANVPAVNNHDGSLLLQVDKGFILSINSVATLIWRYLEQTPNGSTLVELADHVEATCTESPKTVLRHDIERDIGELLSYLEDRQVVKKRSRRNSETLYRIVEGVLRTHDNGSTTSTANQHPQSASEVDVARQIKQLLTPVSKDPSLGTTIQDQIARINRYQSKTHTAVALLTFIAYDMLMKMLGFHRICRIITRAVFKKHRSDRLCALRVCAGVERARIWYPKEIRCMQHSLVIKFLLNRCGLNTQVAIAGRSMPFQSHAWVELEGIVINDTQKVRQFYKVFTYI